LDLQAAGPLRPEFAGACAIAPIRSPPGDPSPTHRARRKTPRIDFRRLGLPRRLARSFVHGDQGGLGVGAEIQNAQVATITGSGIAKHVLHLAQSRCHTSLPEGHSKTGPPEKKEAMTRRRPVTGDAGQYGLAAWVDSRSV